MKALGSAKLAVIGLGYVGLPLAAEFGKHYKTIGYDLNCSRVNELLGGKDSTLELDASELRNLPLLSLSAEVEDIKDCNVYIVTVPTPITDAKLPDLTPLEGACRMIAPMLSYGDTVIFESTVYPGATEEVCVPILEEISGLFFNKDFFVGYSPERINPGDKVHTLTTIIKVTSGSTPETADFVDSLYSSIITAGTHKASSLKVAEAAKVIENVQRDVNIGLMNELAIIFNKLGIDTKEVLDAAGTKWNFLKFSPGLVGGHCISVDPYYLTHKSQMNGYHPDVILSSRKLNDHMPGEIISQIVHKAIDKRIHIRGAKTLIMGLTFKENCPDLRNSKVFDIVDGMIALGAEVDAADPWVTADSLGDKCNLVDYKQVQNETYDIVIMAVSHQEFIDLGIQGVNAMCRSNRIIYDVKSMFSRKDSDLRL